MEEVFGYNQRGRICCSLHSFCMYRQPKSESCSWVINRHERVILNVSYMTRIDVPVK